MKTFFSKNIASTIDLKRIKIKMKKPHCVTFLFFLTFFLHFTLEPLQPEEIDNDLYQQARVFDPQAANSYYCGRISSEIFLNFLDIYQGRPIQENEFGMRSQGMFFLWYLIKEINPSLVIESGIHRGQSTWMIEQAAPLAKVIAIDPVLENRVYISERALYTTGDFSTLDIDNNLKKSTICFFDDHQNAFDRILQANEKGIKYLIFDDNYRPGYNEFGRSQLTLRECFELKIHRKKALVLNKLIKHYYIMPQIVGNFINHFYGGINSTAYAPAIWRSLEEIDISLRGKMKTFYDDSVFYRWITYVELY
jgi:hypothetical protein